MGWIDDRIYCHPKVLRVGKPARWTYVAGIAYSSGWGTRGVLERGALEAIGCDAKSRKELVKSGLWDEVDGVVFIHDWDEHNEKRDARRRADRERKRLQRSTGLSTGTSAGQTADKHADGSALKEVKEVKEEQVLGTSTEYLSKAVKNPRPPDSETPNGHEADTNGLGHISGVIEQSLREATKP